MIKTIINADWMCGKVKKPRESSFCFKTTTHVFVPLTDIKRERKCGNNNTSTTS